ncbi:MAG: hypothetical protein J6U99_03905 [Rikenellaceae bacterium]|nr:hypothetical protein [Rikenellaceae bacterium]
MKKTIFTALLSLVAIICIAIGKPYVTLTAQGPVGVLPNEPFTFTIAYYNVQEMVIEVNGVPDEQWLWWWEREQEEWNYESYTDQLTEYNMTNRYSVTVTNDQEHDFEEIVYCTPQIGR